MVRNRSLLIFIGILGLIFVSATFLHSWVTEPGIGFLGDAVPYMLTARSLTQGNGFYILDKPMTHWAPAYPLMLAIWSILGPSLRLAARSLHTLIFGINAVLFAVTIFISTRRNYAAMVTGALFFISSSSILFIHSVAWSESPFLLFALLSYFLFLSFFLNEKFIFLICSALVMGFAIATRYVGFALLPPVVFILFFMLKRSFLFKIKSILVTGITALIPISVWTIRNQLLVGSSADRSIVFHPRSIVSLSKSFITVFHNFILPDTGSNYLNAAEIFTIVLILFLIALSLFKNRTAIKADNPASFYIITLGMLFTISYIAILIVSIYFLDAAVPVDNRLLFPVLVFLSITVFSMVSEFARDMKKSSIFQLFGVCVILLIRLNAPYTILQAKEMHSSGIGYNSLEWQKSELMTFLKSENPTSKIYSDGYYLIPLLTKIKADTLPKKFSNNTLLENPDFDIEILEMCQEIREGNAVVIYVDIISKQNLLSESGLLTRCELPVMHNFRDGTIYGYNLHGTP